MKQLRNFKHNNEMNKSDKEYVNEALNKYGGLEEDELISELLKSVERSKKDGTYNPAQMQSFLQTVSPLINEKQREKLKNVVSLINSDEV